MPNCEQTLPRDNGNDSEARFLAAYTGSSMFPTLREPELVEVMPYGKRRIGAGDVIFFLPPGTDKPVVHRVTRSTPEGIATRGDNNTRADPCILRHEDIRGRVVAAWRGQERRTIPGGWQGRLARRWFLGWLGLCRRATPLLHPLYKALFDGGWMARWVPVRFRPRVVVYQDQGRKQFQLLLGRRLIGRYDTHRHRWQIQRPFHLLVEKQALAVPVNPERQYALALADGSRWDIAGEDAEAAALVSQLGCSMRLQESAGQLIPSPARKRFRLIVQVDIHSTVADCYVPLASENDGVVVCVLSPVHRWGSPYVNLVRLALIVAREAQARGGILLHGALAERNGKGVILAAPGGTGKTTASNRFPSPWRSLCDDSTLVVRDATGRYRAHPWPTWSRFLEGGAGGSWDVQGSVPLSGIFFLVQAAEDRTERVGPGQAVSLLIEGSRQASQFMPLGLRRDQVRALHLEAFNNLCGLSKAIPAHLLHISLTGAFWREIDRALEGSGHEA